MISTRRLAVILAAAVVVLTVAATATAGRPGFVFPGGCCFYEGDTVRTVGVRVPERGHGSYAVMATGVQPEGRRQGRAGRAGLRRWSLALTR
jgi:hypothetical protein